LEEQLPRKFGKYTLLRRLAVGGMAEIYLALHRSISGFEKVLVIKRILPNLTQDPEFLRMLLDEARIAATLNHPNIAQIYDVDSIDETYFIAMEHVHGEDLRSMVRAMKKKKVTAFPLEHALQIIIGACAALEYAHTRTDLQGEPLAIVHRDVSPQNVLVTFAGDVKLVDFGIARANMVGHEQSSGEGELRGKVPYMSPEQCRGKLLDRRSDIFSLGILLFELSTGKRLFRTSNEFTTMQMIVEHDYPRPGELVEGYSKDLEAIVSKALAKDREARYGSARDLQSDLEDFIQEQRIATSSLKLAGFMERIFEEKLALQREALAQGKRLADIIALEEERAGESPSGSVGSPGAASLSGPPSQGPSSVEIELPSGISHEVSALPPEPVRRKGRRRGLLALLLFLGIIGGAAVVWGALTASSGSSPEVPSDVLGSLTVESTPLGAKVSLDGRDTGETTPVTFDELRAERTYQVKVSKDGYGQVLRDVRLSATDPQERLSVELGAVGKGIVSLATDPSGATIFLDGQRIDAKTPTTVDGISPDVEQRVLVKLDGYLDTSDTITVSPGQDRRLFFELERRPLEPGEALLVITSVPPGAKVTVDGQTRDGVTPWEARFEAGRRAKVSLSLEGFELFSENVRLEGGQEVEIKATLARPRRQGAGTGGTSRPAGKGRLYFDAVPFCNVTIGGRSFGPTPIVNVELPAGTTRIRCQSPPIGVTKTITVNVPVGGTVRRRVKLTP